MAEERIKPRISINKLGEYLVATPVRRRKIIEEQKRPKNFIVTRYKEAREGIIKFIQNGLNDDSIIDNIINDLENMGTNSDFQAQDKELSIQALERTMDLSADLSLEGLTIKICDNTSNNISIAGVSISVRPDLMLEIPNDTEPLDTGLIKIYLSKSYPLSEEAGSYIGAVLRRYAETYLSDKGKCDYKLCQVIDVFNRKVHIATRSITRRFNDIEAACQEIAARWDTV